MLLSTCLKIHPGKFYMKRFMIKRSKDEFCTAHSGLSLVGLFLNRYCNLVAKLDKAAPVSSIGILPVM